METQHLAEAGQQNEGEQFFEKLIESTYQAHISDSFSKIQEKTLKSLVYHKRLATMIFVMLLLIGLLGVMLPIYLIHHFSSSAIKEPILNSLLSKSSVFVPLVALFKCLYNLYSKETLIVKQREEELVQQQKELLAFDLNFYTKNNSEFMKNLSDTLLHKHSLN
jgi:hypothetical protein